MLRLGQLRTDILALANGDDSAQKQAVFSLKQRNEQDWASAPSDLMDRLTQTLQEQLVSGTKHPFIRKDLAIIVGKIGPRAKVVVPQLVGLLREGVSDSTREEVARTLGKIGWDAKVAVEQLVHLASSGRPSLARQALSALASIGCADLQVRTGLLDLWLSANQSPARIVQVAFALCKLKIDAMGLVTSLASILLKNDDPILRKSAADALAWCSEKDKDVVPALLAAALSDKNENVQSAAESGLVQLGMSHENAVQVCTKHLTDSSYAESALRHSGSLAVPVLIVAVTTPDLAVQTKAIRILGGLGELAVAAVPALTKASHDKDVDVRLAAAKALWNVSKKPDPAVSVLIELLGEAIGGDELRRRFLQTVIEALWRIGPEAHAALPALHTMAKEKNRNISDSALSAIRTITATATGKASLASAIAGRKTQSHG